MEIIDTQNRNFKRIPRTFSIEFFVGIIAITAAVVMMWIIISVANLPYVLAIAGLIFTICVSVIIYLTMNPDTIRARQTASMLRMSSIIVDLMANGMTPASAQGICAMLLPSTAAIAVSITDKETILGYVGYQEAENPQGAAIKTQATHDALEDGRPRVIYTPEEIGLPKNATMIKAAIIVPLHVGRDTRGVLKFYYKNSHKITETQKSIAQGFGELLSTQIAASELEEQRELATAMELKMLQSQINPHFLFNTINTIASLIRTDPMKARTLLREFAVFYRSTLENSQDRIPLGRELEQTQRYFSFEVARFGEERLAMIVQIDEVPNETVEALEEQLTENTSLAEMPVPPFLLQPLVENAVKHAMGAEGKLTVRIYSRIEDADVLICVEDDGVGMSEEAREKIMNTRSSTGLGIAVKNVHDRMIGYYGKDALMLVESELGVGTTITLRFPGMADRSRW